MNARLPAALDAVVACALAKSREDRFASARDFAVAVQAAIRRAEDQTVVPPLNPQRKADGALSRPLSRPGTLPSGTVPPGTAPGVVTNPSAGSVTSVTQELELVYWKDVKDTTDAEDLHVFLEKFPTGIYADLARRRLRKLTGEGVTSLRRLPAAARWVPAPGRCFPITTQRGCAWSLRGPRSLPCRLPGRTRMRPS